MQGIEAEGRNEAIQNGRKKMSRKVGYEETEDRSHEKSKVHRSFDVIWRRSVANSRGFSSLRSLIGDLASCWMQSTMVSTTSRLQRNSHTERQTVPWTDFSQIPNPSSFHSWQICAQTFLKAGKAKAASYPPATTIKWLVVKFWRFATKCQFPLNHKGLKNRSSEVAPSLPINKTFDTSEGSFHRSLPITAG